MADTRHDFNRRMRQVWIDARFADHGRVSRTELCEALGGTLATATADLSFYAASQPGHVARDGRRRSWIVTEAFRPAHPATLRLFVTKAVEMMSVKEVRP